MTPTLKQLRYLSLLAEYGSFSRAAEAAHIAQPSLSAAIAELEATLGQRLIDRAAKGGLVLTTLGAETVQRAHHILTAVDDLVAAARAQKAPLSGVLRLGAIPTIAPFYLPDVLKRTRRACPKAQISIVEGQSEDLIEALRTGALDVALMALPYPLSGLSHLVLYDDPLALIVPHGHVLTHLTEVQAADLGHQPLLFLEDGHCLREHALAACPAQTTPSRGVRAASLYTLAHLVAAGHGLALVPQMALEHGLIRGLAVKALPFVEPAPHRTIALVWRAASPASADARALGSILKL